MAICSICLQEVKENVNSDKVITCGRCVQVLLTAGQENKKAFRGTLSPQGRAEAARSVESFILPEANGEIATFENKVRLRGFKHGIKHHSGRSK